MTAHKDTQREHDINQQRAYGEAPSAQDSSVLSQRVTSAAGARQGAVTEDLDHGFKRDEDGRQPVVSKHDERHPNAPDTMGADTGPMKAAVKQTDMVEANELLEDAYSKNDPGVETKA